MPFDVSGNFTRSHNFVQDRDNGIKISASRMDTEFNNFATGLNQLLLRSGVAAMTGTLNLGGNDLAALGSGVVATPAVRFSADPSTGMYSPGTGKVAFSASGVQRLEVNTTGVTVNGRVTATEATLSTALPIASGGTGIATVPSNGQIPMGNGAGGYGLVSLVAGTNITLTPGAGTLTVAAAGGVTSVNASGGTTGLSFSGGPVVGAGTLTLAGTLAVANGGTGAVNAANARTNLGAAASGANADITSLAGLTTPLSLAQGGTAATTAAGARTSFGLGNIATLNAMSAAEYRANTANRVVTTDAAWSAADIVALTDAATIAVDMSTFLNASVTLGGNRTLGAPTNAKPGQSGVIKIVQDGTGSRTLAFHANWKFAGGVDPVLSTTANAIDSLKYFVHGANEIEASLTKDIR